jgi:hypothetical protein
MRTIIALCAVVLVALALRPAESGAARKNVYVNVAAGALDRRETIVSFALPAELTKKNYSLRDDAGAVIPLQVDAKRQATFALPELKAGATKKYLVVEMKTPAAASAAQSMQVVDEGKRLAVKLAGREIIGFQTKPELPADVKPVFARAGYIHPIYTPSGRLVSDDYPSDHYHHHGIWAAWTKTEFEGRHPDFWNVHDGTGRVDFVGVDETWGGPVHGGFRSRQNYVDVSGPAPKVALNETWEVLVYRVGTGARAYTMFDLVSTQTTATSEPLVLDEYRYGGVGVRGHREWKDKSKVFFLTSEGKDRANGNATRGRWCHIGGPVGGQLVGIATFDHPGNLRAPQPMRLNPDDPFFNWAPSQLGKFEIKPGEAFVSRYRFVVADGAPDKAELDRLWNDYATPPQITITKK